MKYDYTAYVNGAIKDSLADIAYEELSAEEILSLCILMAEVCWFPSSDASGSDSLWKTEPVQDKLERLTAGSLKRCGLTDNILDFSRLVKSLHLLYSLPVTFFEKERYGSFDSQLERYVLHNPHCDSRVVHNMFYAIGSGPTQDRPGMENSQRVLKMLARSLQAYADSQNADGSWTGVHAEEAFERIYVVSQYSCMVEDINPVRTVSVAYAYYSKQPCDTPSLLYAKYKANNCKNKYDEGGEEVGYFFEKAVKMLAKPGLPYSDRLRLQYIICETGSYLEDWD